MVRGWGRRVGSDRDLLSGVEPPCNPREMGLSGEGSLGVRTRGGTLAP